MNYRGKISAALATMAVLGGILAACSGGEVGPSPAPTTPVGAACGSPGAPKCNVGALCKEDAACATLNCSFGQCGLATCSDKKRDGDELGVDCGGSCAKCDGDSCTANAGCQSKLCVDNKCAASGTKTCGVGVAALCADGAICAQPADCTSDYCGSSGKCGQGPPIVHDDGLRNALETDVDCGGPSASSPRCVSGKTCKVTTDCYGACDTITKKCVNPAPNDGKQNGDETDIDCGGAIAPACPTGKACLANADCGLKSCAANLCVTPTGSDGKKNGNETDIDCGGAALSFGGVTVPAAARCADAKSCAADTDCTNSTCAGNMRCVEAPSCRNVRGGYTCGTGETGQPNAQHESCCISYPVPNLTENVGGVPKQVYLDKYEITAGRVRAWLTDIRRQYGGVPNIQAWVAARKATDPYLATMYPATVMGYLPKQDVNQPVVDENGVTVLYKVLPSNFTNIASEFNGAVVPDRNNYSVSRDAGLYAQIGPTSYYRAVTVAGTSGCAMYNNGYGHRTYHDGPAVSAYFGEPARSAAALVEADDKAVNCLPPLMYAAFCAWDGGYLTSKAAAIAAYGPGLWPSGASLPTEASVNLATERTVLGNFNWGVNSNPFTPARRPAYNWPALGDGTWALDYTPVIAPPGRFPADIASATRPGQPSWMDMGSNMIELSQTSGNIFGWYGSSWEGHVLPRGWDYPLERMEKYGKSGARCMRFR